MLTRLVFGCALLLVCVVNDGDAPPRSSPPVTFVPVQVSSRFAAAIADGALSYACAPFSQYLADFFKARSLPFEASLLRKDEHGSCHIFYEPSLRGFGASPVNAPAAELFFNIDALALLTGRPEKIGDSLDIAREILSEVKRPLAVTLNVGIPGHEAYYERALRLRFGACADRFTLHHVPLGKVDPWIQDFMKSGQFGSARKILISRRAFEGNPENGAAFQPMLDSFPEPEFVRSKLSFEGGDLAFVRDPIDRRLTMFYGTSAQEYWGAGLTRDEFEYVLKLEFGAAKAIYAGGVTPHVDYHLKFLRTGRIALLAEPVSGNLQLARAALAILLRSYPEPRPAQLTGLARILSPAGDVLRPNAGQIIEATRRASAAPGLWKVQVSDQTRRQIDDFVRQHCPANPLACVQGENLSNMLDDHPDILAHWVRSGTSLNMQDKLALRLFEIIRRQASPPDDAARAALDQQAEVLQTLGYRVIRVPWLPGDGAPLSQWPGISYTNSVEIDDLLFVPEMGFEKVEAGWFDRLQRALGDSYRVVALPAQRLLIDNGGLHCAMAIARENTPND